MIKDKYEPLYWNDKGQKQAQYSILWDKYIPGHGDCLDECLPEALRLMNKIYYDLYNNAGINLDYGRNYWQWSYNDKPLVFLKQFIGDSLYKQLYDEVKAVCRDYNKADSFAGNDTGAADLALSRIVGLLWSKYQGDHDAESQQV